MIHIGLPSWSTREWRGTLFDADAPPEDYLPQYASVFNAVEGNTTFYGIPTAATVQKWREQVPADFRFCFKMPKSVTHNSALQRCDLLVKEFLKRMEPLAPVMGPMMIQLPATFSPQSIDILQSFLRRLPMTFRYAVEVRHPDFFTLGVVNESLNRLLERCGVERVNFDSRALFACDSSHPDVLEAKNKKPQLPYHCHALGKAPILRFIGQPQLDANDEFFEPWINTIAQWLKEGRKPLIFVHLPNNIEAPKLAYHLHQKLRERIELPALRQRDMNAASIAPEGVPQLDLF